MGFNEDDTDIYKFDVSSTGIPTNKHPWEESDVNGPALSSGVVELRCFINPMCPFVKRALKEEVVVFNSQTLAKKTMEEYFPDYFNNLMTTTSRMEGIHFRPKYVYRHNYVYYPDPTKSAEWDFIPLESLLGEDFDEYYKEITGNNLLHQEHTRYREEQSWIIVPSVFEGYYGELKNTRGLSDSPGLSAEICDFSSLWKYSTQSRPSEANKDDIMLDYEYDFYKEYKDEIPANLISMPGQRFSSTYRTGGPGIHWRLLKKTELYKGEDFFVEFKKGADSEDVRKSDEKAYRFKVDRSAAYASLDISYNPNHPDTQVETTEGKLEPFNSAVLSVISSDKEGKMEYVSGKTFDFTDQPYYIIELGYCNFDNNYFIIICARSAPIFVHIDKYKVSRRLSEDPNTSGEKLINSKWFRMTVRNHLGKLVITFDAEGKETSEPWIIERTDKEDGNGEGDFIEEVKELSVPRGQMTLWGGNILTSFTFGPLQYRGGGIGFVYPPDKTGLQSDDGTIVHEVNETQIVPVPPYLSLPSETSHHYKFAMSNLDPEDFKGRYPKGDVPGTSLKDREMFTQDAQFYKEYDVSYDGEGEYSGKSSDWTYGSFFYGPTIKELLDLKGGDSPGIKDSLIMVERHTDVEEIDERRKMHKFSLKFLMFAGDHVFNKNYSPVTIRGEPLLGRGRASILEDHDYGDDRWIVLSCKTPILTQLRLISDENSEHRWDDGTSAGSYRGLPLSGNPYFIDASDHVLDYDETWSAPDFYSIEHTGTIRFLVNKNLQFGDPTDSRPNVTNALLNLQNKTFYIEIWGGYSRKETKTRGGSSKKQSNYTRIPGLYKLFTGLCHGGEVQHSYGRRIMSCKIEDYSKVLKDQLFFNSPFYDGMKDVFAIYEILRMAGFSSKNTFDPASILKLLTENVDADPDETYWTDIDKRTFKANPYTLPAEYERLNQAAFRFKSGSNYYDAIHNMAQRASKVFYFDQFGVAHFEDFFDMIVRDLKGGEDIPPLFEFTQNPEHHVGQMVFNKVDHAYNVSDVVNHIKMLTTSPARQLLIGDYLNWEGVENPDTEGFIGYLKTFYQQEGMFGSERATKNIMNFYTIMFKPPVTYNFETYGLPLRALDMVSINGQTARVSSVKHQIDPKENRWWMNVETERYQPIAENYANEMEITE